MTLGEFLVQYQALHKISLGKLSEKTGISKATLSLWKRGISSRGDAGPPAPEYHNLKKLADGIGMDIHELIATLEGVPFPKHPYSKVKNIVPVPEGIYEVPILGTIAGGEPITAIEDREIIKSSFKADFCLRVQGDSMKDAGIRDGDIVFCVEQPEVYNGEIAAVIVNGDEATLKRFYSYGDTVVLRPENREYSEQVFTGAELAEIRILGKAVACLSAVN